MSSLAALRDGIRATLTAAIPGVHVYDTVPESVILPCVVVAPVSANFDRAMGRGVDEWQFDLLVLVSWGDSDVAQTNLDTYVAGAGASSVRQVIFQNRTLGLSDTDAHVSELLDYGAEFPAAGADHVGARLRLIAYTSGTA